MSLYPVFVGVALPVIVHVMAILDVLRLKFCLDLLRHLISVDWEYPFIVAKVFQKSAQPLLVSSLQLSLGRPPRRLCMTCIRCFLLLHESLDFSSLFLRVQCQHLEGIRQHLHFDNVLESATICKIRCLIHLEQPWLALIIYDHVECQKLEAHLVLVVRGQCQFVVVHQVWLETQHRFDYYVFHSEPQFVDIYALIFHFGKYFVQSFQSPI